MNDMVFEYLNEQYCKLKNDYDNYYNLIRSDKFKIQTIENKIKNIKKMQDDTLDILSPDYCNNDFNHNEISKLYSIKDKLNNEIENNNQKIIEIEKEIKRVKCIIDTYKETQKETNKNKNTVDLNTFSIQEMDRERISRDIHDTVVQNLTALIRKTEFISKIINQDPSRAKLEISSSQELIKNTISELRNIIYDLRPMSLKDLGFEATYYDMCDNFKNSYSGIFKYTYKCDISEENINCENQIYINILRIIKELCSNSIKYSNGNSICVNIHIYKDKICVVQYDNGSDFDYYNFIGEKPNHTGYGLIMLNERINILNGNLEFDNTEGSKYTITFPLVV